MTEASDRPTIVTVANEAGVSIASVSRVLNGLPASPAMVARVREATDRLGYMPDAAARSLKAGRTNQLAFAVPDIANPVYIEVMRSIERTTKGFGFRLLVHSTSADSGDELEMIQSLRHRYVDGLVMTSLRLSPRLLDAMSGAAVPVVVVGNIPDGYPIDSVSTSSRHGAQLAIEHLVASGRRSIGFINGPEDTGPGRSRRLGYAEALAAARLRENEDLVAVCDDFTHQAGYEATKKLLGATKPDALFCANDLLAVGALRAIAEGGLSVPRDIAVVGLDDTELAAMTTPSLSSVSLRSAERGRLAAQLLLERLADPTLPPRRFEVAAKLVVRESSDGAPAQRQADP